MPRQPLTELPLNLFLPTLFPTLAQGGPSTPHPGAYKPKPPPTPSHHPAHILPHGLKRPRASSPGKSSSAKRRHVDDQGAGMAKRLFDGIPPTKPAEGSTPIRKERKKLAPSPSPDLTPRLPLPLPPTSTYMYGSHSAPTTVKPRSTVPTLLSVPSSAAHRSSPEEEEDKENHPPRQRRLLLSAGKASTPKRFTSDAKGKGRDLGLMGSKALLGLGVGVGKPATPREIGREMLLREVEEPEEVDVDEEMF
ncbi:hypothetical protein CALVIDRAFT_527972 [Calocera viscosa TUFC12733]|uniref:WH2 domain-containing protein n=1 Tax=Calocera viscosa (strain TUFC12733) TaxID=1330018 RepID=A0A167LAG2_CALVF|nr:hypothetical protein CALVIDRAFT_527972 [Calocera viscosa TUFC12733]